MSKATLLSELSTHQSTLTTKQTELANVVSVIGTKQTELAAQPPVGVLVAELQENRRQLEAAEELGETVEQSEYDAIDAAITAAQADDAETQKITELLATLNQKKQGLEKEFDDLNSKIRRTGVLYLKEDMEEIAADYMTAAEQVVTLFRKLQGRSFIFDNKRWGSDAPTGTRNEHRFLSIPVFRLDACGQHPNQSRGWPEYNLAHTVKHEYVRINREDVEAAKADLAAVGLTFNI